ncbi:molybdenum cofactor biosynthesis protein MoaE [Asticcacaulis sp. EMRT-3]|uniref:molybdenum cofactor biosynthesis protein MoaE n=1 Tax=Asticcacaulis sp. EMRT-3 TaxID=3040349 RepID=UPI0024AFD681|nr:molybdenum cofactor biosynthesis protein MoaE [Asticcacaulis sp. EMRT-3]MDI7773946.1 molybdenum cofactor biosynthesis protein MoaE [Asticcacaulis sp. EMRT-3]
MTVRDIRVGEAAIDPAGLHAAFLSAHGAAGAVVSFSGLVRGQTKAGAVEHLWLDWYPGMTEDSVTAIVAAAADRFAVTALLVHHRCGEIHAGEPIVFVAAASAHRRAAFEAADYLMDRLKSEAAFWKRETTAGGAHWVEPTADDQRDLDRWSQT